MFTVGDRVIYGASGVCKITDIVENELTGVLRQYYLLSPVSSDKSLIYVPLNNEKLIQRMRKVPTPKELKKILAELKHAQLEWIDNNLERSERYHAVVNDGDIKENIKLLRTLYSRQCELLERGKQLPKSDERIYKECSKLLCSEFSFILDLEHSEILALILEG